jgi:hypothetical protein
MVTSTSNFDEVRKLLDLTLMEMGLSASPRNCLFLLNELKALSGRFVMRLSGSGNRPQEMVALAMTHAVSRKVTDADEQWLSLKEGFFVPIDDIPDLLGIENETGEDDKRRADLLYVTVPRKGAGFQFTFVEVKFRRYLKTARANDVLEAIEKQLKSSRQKWEQLYGAETSPLEKVVRRSWLARILKFYTAKGRRHYLNDDAWQRINRELDKMVREGEGYLFPEANEMEASDRGFIFCPEYTADVTSMVSYQGQPEIYLFGGNEMPDPPMRGISMTSRSNQPSATSISTYTEELVVSKSQQSVIEVEKIDGNTNDPESENAVADDTDVEIKEVEIATKLQRSDTPVLLGQRVH